MCLCLPHTMLRGSTQALPVPRSSLLLCLLHSQYQYVGLSCCLMLTCLTVQAWHTMLYAVACTHAAQTPLHPELCRYLQDLPQTPYRPAFHIMPRNSTTACMYTILSKTPNQGARRLAGATWRAA